MGIKERIHAANSRRKRDRAYYKKEYKQYAIEAARERRSDERAALDLKAKQKAAAKYGRSTTQKAKSAASTAIKYAKRAQQATKSKPTRKTPSKRRQSTRSSDYVLIGGKAYRKGAPQKRRRKTTKKKGNSDPLSFKFTPFKL